MTFATVVQTIGLILAGILAGEEFIVRWGVQPALTRLDDRPHLLARIALVKQLKVVVPAIMVPTVIVAVVALVAAGGSPGFAWRVAGLAFLVAFVLISFLGTVPINIKVDAWNADAPPGDWKAVVHRWETIDVFRSSAALASFVCWAIALAVQPP